MAYSVQEKIIISGDYVEIYKYSRGYYVGVPQQRSIKRSVEIYHHIKKQQQEIRIDSLKRTKKRLKRMVNSNKDLNKFLTLTFADNVTDLKIANNEFKKFIKRLNYKYPKFKYVAVPEFQERGAVHYHLLCNIRYLTVSELDELRQMWGNGWIDLRRIDKVENVGNYMAKCLSYLGKANQDNRLFGRKKFFYSINLLTPVIYDRWSDIKEFYEFWKIWIVKKLLWKTEFDTKWLGSVSYEIYRL